MIDENYIFNLEEEIERLESLIEELKDENEAFKTTNGCFMESGLRKDVIIMNTVGSLKEFKINLDMRVLDSVIETLSRIVITNK